MDWGHCWKHTSSPFSTNFTVDMVTFVDPHKLVAKRNAFSAFPIAWNGGESEGGIENGGFKRQFSQVERDLDSQEIPKRICIFRKRALKCGEDEEGEKVERIWVDGEVLHLIVLRGEMELEFAKNVKKKE